MKVSFSKVECHHSCPYCYKLVYVDKLEPIEDQSPTNALYLGTACHEGIEKRDIQAALDIYRSKYADPSSDAHKLEEFKLETVLKQAIDIIPEGIYEKRLDVQDEFVGYIDCLVPVSEGVWDLLDFKYSNNAYKYRQSGQVHIYKAYFEKITGEKIRDMYYVMLPKSTVSYNENLSLEDQKQKVSDNLKNRTITFEKIEYDPKQVGFFYGRKIKLEKDTTFEKKVNRYCEWCAFKRYCRTNGEDRSELKPKLEEVALF